LIECPFCWPTVGREAILESDLCVFIKHPSTILNGSGMIIPKAHRETVFDLTAEEIKDTIQLLTKVKELIDSELKPDGYNVGWNCYPVGGQTVAHSHLHVIPRFSDEPLAGKGIRHHLKQDENKRKQI
jgi:diadenosine tetraphosphate (Ap4A) HIT family hydrolase